MPRYRVTVSYTMERDIGVWANSSEDAEDKACEIVGNWNGVLDAEAVGVEEDDAA